MGPKKKTKKGSHTTPEVHPHVLKRREAERIKAEKKFARILKKLKKSRKGTKTTTLSSDSEASFPEIIPCETSDGESDLQSNPDSACRESITSLAGEQKMMQKTDSIIKETRRKDRTESQCDVPEMSENVTGKQPFRKNVVETEKDSSKHSPIKSLDDKKLRKKSVRTQVASKNKEFVEETEGKETLKSKRPIKNTDCFDDFPKEFSEARKKLTENLLKKKNELQLKLQTFESERKHLDEQRNKLLSSKKRVTFKDPDLAIIGDIKLRTPNESGKKNKTQDIYSYYDKNKRVLHIGDEHVQIAILINQGSQVICKSRSRPLINSNQDNVESDRQMLKSETIKSDQEILFDSEDREKSRTDTKFTTNNISEFASEKYQALEDQAISKSDGDIIHDKTKDEMTTETKCTTDIVGESASDEYQMQDQAISKSDGDVIPDKKQQDEMTTETKCTPNRAGKASEKNSGLSSVQESVKTICENFLKDFISACEQFETRMRNLIKEDQNLKK